MVTLTALGVLFFASPEHPDSFKHYAVIRDHDSDAEILEKAARVVPNTPQLLHHEDEFIGFIHFGPNTFTGVEWGSGKEDPTVFDPGETLDTDQWCRIMKAAGMAKVVITVKHHDGFCLWQTRYNDTFSVRATPWRDGKGDVLRELSESCRKYGLKLGVYVSPADLYQIENLEHGLYGNESICRKTVIPTDPVSFKTDPTRVRADKPAHAPTFTVEADDYNRYFMNQLYEVLTEYGPIHEVWFDGAHPKRKGGQTYIKTEWFKMIRSLAPEAAIFGGPDSRWCGNESGVTRDSEWSVLPVEDISVIGLDRPEVQVGTADRVTAESYTVYGKEYRSRFLYYLVNEVDTSLRAGWFWRDDVAQSVRTPDDTFDIYERSVGGNSVFLLNIPPNDKGLFSQRDEDCMLEVGRRIRQTYTTNLLEGSNVVADGKTVEGLLDGMLESYWQAAGLESALYITLPTERTINRFMCQEAIGKVGQRVKAHSLEAWLDGDWRVVAEGTTVGYKKILRFPSITTDRLRLKIIDARLAPSIASIGAFFYPTPPPPVKLRRLGNAFTLEAVRPSHYFAWKHKESRKEIPHDTTQSRIVYTLDGSEPTLQSTAYTGPIDLPDGGWVKARSVTGTELGPIADERIGMSPEGWRVSSSSEQSETHAAQCAIDGDPDTFWHTEWNEGHPVHPHTFTIELGRSIDAKGFTYLPRQDRRLADSMIEKGVVEVSSDGEHWKNAGTFVFGNLLNDPTRRTFFFDRPLTFSYLRIVSLEGTQGNPYAGAAEIGILNARTGNREKP